MIAIYVIAAILALLVGLNLVVGRLPHKPPAGGGVVETTHGPIHYLEDLGTGPPIVFIHGMPGLSRDFDLLRAELDGYHTIAFDRPGYGWSTGSPQGFNQQLDAIVEAAATLGIDRAVVVGHSFGGLLALGLAIRSPAFTLSLLLLAPAAGGTRVTKQRVHHARWIQLIETPGVCQVLDLLFLRILRKFAARQGAVSAYGTDDRFADQRHLAEAVLSRHNSVRALANDRMIFNDTERMVTRNLKRIEAPSIIVRGEQDSTITARNALLLADGVAGSEMIEIQGDHQLPAKKPAQVVDVLRRLMARTDTLAR